MEPSPRATLVCSCAVLEACSASLCLVLVVNRTRAECCEVGLGYTHGRGVVPLDDSVSPSSARTTYPVEWHTSYV